MNDQTMYETMPAVSGLNRVEGFEPKTLMREIGEEQNKQLYLDVAIRKLWFRLKYPLGMIHKKIAQMNEQFAIVEARVYLDKGDPEDGFVSNAFARRYFSTDNEFGPKYLEMAETAAVGRALADAGFGSQFADIEGDTDSEQVDAGVRVTAPVAGAESVQEESDDTGETGVKKENGIAYQAAPAAGTKPVAPAQPVKLAYTISMPVDDILAMMTLDEAKNLVVTIGQHKGKTLGVIAVDCPRDLQWYIESYKGPDNILRAAATFLVKTAMQEAG